MSREVEMDIHRLLGDVLYSKNDGAAYTAMTRLMALLKEDSSRMEYLPSYHYHRDVIKRLLSVIGRMEADHAQAALQVLVHFLHLESVCKTLDAEFVFDSLCSTLQKADDKQICIRILWCMEKQEFPIKAFDNFSKFDAVFQAMKRLLRRENMTFTSATLDFEIGGVLKRFLSQCPYEMMTRVDDWLDILFLLAMNSAKQVHDVAMELFSEYKLVIDERRPLGAYCLANLEKLIVPAMKKLLSERGTEREALATWCYFLELLGPEAHHRSVINKLLFVVEAAFKNPDSNVKIAAFQSWTVLMDSFATNASVLNNNKHIRLLMQPFLVNNAKTEDIALAKFDAWWHLIVLLREQMGEHFDLVLSPLLSFASGLPVTMPHTPSRIGALSPSVSMPSFASVQLRGCECLVHLLESSEVQLLMPKSSATYSFTVPPLSDGVKVLSSPQRFLKNHKILIGTTKRLVMSLENAIPAPLLYRLFNALVSHCDVMVTSLGWGVTSPAATAFMTSFEAIVTATSLDGERLMRLFRNVCLLPDKFLCCHQFYTGEDRNGCPALTLLELLLGQKMITVCEHSQRMEMFTDIVKMGVAHGTNMLKFSQSALALLAASANRIEDKERLFQLWSSMAKTLHDQILKTNEVNQGDALEHDFSCMYDLLTFPVQHILVRTVPQSCHASLNKLWSDVYATFSRLSALVPNAPPNTCADQSAARIAVTSTVTSLTDDVAGEKWEVLLVHSLCAAVETMTSCLDYSAFSNHRPSAFSPSKFMSPPSKRQKPLGTLHHPTQLLSLLLQLLTKLNQITSTTQTKLLNEAGTTLLRAITHTIQGVTSPSILQILIQELTENLALMIRKSTKIGEEKSVFSAEFALKIQSFWADVGKVWMARCPGTKDSEFLEKVEPLFTATFQHQKKQIKQTSLSLWSAWFGSAEHLVYPEQLRPVLSKLKDKHSISLPGFHPNVFDAAKDSAVSESQLTQGESQVPLPDIAGLPSPSKKVHGSFLTKVPSPAKSTPEKQDGGAVAKRQATPFPRATKSAAHAQDEFVVIAPEPKKKLVLTDHQKEVMRRKSALPSMYNNLDASVDTSMHTDFFSQSEGSSQDVPASASLLPQVSQLFPSSQPFIPPQNVKNTEKTETVQNTENEENTENKENVHVRKVHFADEKDSDVMILSQKGEENMEIEITDTPMETSEVVEETQLSMSDALASATGKTKAKESENEKKTESEEHSTEGTKKKEISKPQTRRGKKKEEGTGDPFSKAKRATPLKLSEVSSSQGQSKEDKTVKLTTGKEVISSQIGFSSQEEEIPSQVQVRTRTGKKEEKSSSNEEKRKRCLSPKALDLGGAGDASQDSNFKVPENVTPERENMESRTEIRVANCSILVEDTQSPEKFNSAQRKRLSTATESSESELNESVAETPEKQPKATEMAEDTPEKIPAFILSKEGELSASDSLKKIPGKRRLMELDQKLYSDTATSESDSVYDADTEVVPESQIAKQPKIVLKKLTPAKILQYSPKKKSPPRSPVVSPVATRSKRKSLLGVKADYQVFETTRGSSSDQDIVPCSQGFGSQASKDERIESSQDRTLVPESELSQKTTRSSAKTASSKKTDSKADKEGVSKTGKETESDLLTSDDDFFNPKTGDKGNVPKDDRAARELKKLSIDMVAISLPRAKRRRSVRDRLTTGDDVTKDGDDVIKESDDLSKDEPMEKEDAADQEPISAKGNDDSKEPIEAKETEPEVKVVPDTKTDKDDSNKKAEEVVNEVVEEPQEEKMEEDVFFDAFEEPKPNSMETEPGSNESVTLETKIDEKTDEKLAEESSEAKPENNTSEQETPVFKSPDKIENPEMPETPKSSGGHRVVRRRFTSAQKSPVASRGMRLLALAKQSNLSSKDKTSPTKRGEQRKPSGVMTDPVRRRGISRVDIILSRSRKALNKSLAAADATSGSSGDDPEQPRRPRPEPRLPSGLSPVMSPGSGILKKRKYMDAACDSPSPPNKHRRVSFAASDDVRVMSEHGDLDLRIKSPMSEAKFSLGAKMSAESLDKPAVSRCLEMTRGASPLVDKSRKVEVSSSKSIVSSIPEETSEEPIPEMDKSSAPASESVQPSETMATEPTQQSAESMDMDNVKPICEKLMESEVPLTEVVGQLTTTMWSHSLKEVLKARCLVTVGDLAKLTEYEIHRLPGVKSPRVETVKAVMDKLVQENELAATELAITSMSPIKSAESPLRSLPSAEEALDSLSPEKEATEDELDETIEMEQTTGEGCQTKSNSSSVQLRLDTDDELTSSQENGNPDDGVAKDGNPKGGQIGKIANDDDSTLDSLPEGVSSSDQVISFKNVSTVEETKMDEVLESEGFDAGEGDMDVDDDVTMSGPMTSTQVDDVVSPEVKRRRSSRRLRDQSQSAIEASETVDQSAKGRRNKKVARDNEKAETEKETDEQSKTKHVPETVQSETANKSRDPSPIVIDQSESTPDTDETVLEQSKSSEASVSILNQSAKATRSRDSTNQSETRTDGPIVIEDSQDSQDTNNNHVDSSKESTPTEQNLWLLFDSILKQILAEEGTPEMPSEGKKLEILLDMSRVQTKLLNMNLPSTSKSGPTQQK